MAFVRAFVGSVGALALLAGCSGSAGAGQAGTSETAAHPAGTSTAEPDAPSTQPAPPASTPTPVDIAVLQDEPSYRSVVLDVPEGYALEPVPADDYEMRYLLIADGVPVGRLSLENPAFLKYYCSSADWRDCVVDTLFPDTAEPFTDDAGVASIASYSTAKPGTETYAALSETLAYDQIAVDAEGILSAFTHKKFGEIFLACGTFTSEPTALSVLDTLCRSMHDPVQ